MNDTTIVYNGVTISNVLTESIDQDVVPEGTGVNPLYVRVTVSVTGILHATPTFIPVTIGRNTEGQALATAYDQIIDNLMQPGRSFLMTVGGTSLFDVIPGHVRPGLANGNNGSIPIQRTDVNHGPIPSVRVLQITSAHSMRIQFRVVMHLPYVDATGQVPGGVISLRFWITEDIDCEDWTTERTYHGTFRVRHLGHNVHTEIRNNLVFPPLVEGFQRKRISLAQRSNGLELDFTITDKEKWAVAPSPATHWEANHSLFTLEPGSLMMGSDVFVRVKGAKTTTKKDLLELCQKVIDTKLHRLDLTNAGAAFLRTYRVRDFMTENQVEIQAMIALVPQSRMLWNVEKGNFGKPLNIGFPDYPSQLPTYNKERAAIVFPTACIKGLFLDLLRDPLHITVDYNNTGAAQQLTYGTLNCIEVVDEPELPDYPNKDSPQHKANAYNVYRMTSQTNANWGYIQLPLGKSSQQNADNTAIIRLHQTAHQLRVRLEAERLGDWPTLPNPQEYVNKLGANFTPIRTPIEASAPILSADGQKTLYHVSVDYLFAQNRPATGVPAGLMPYRVQGQDSVFVMPASVFSSNGIIFA